MGKNKRDREEACYVCNHYHDYENGEPCSVCGHVLAHHERKKQEVMPTAILNGFLYLGSYDTASRSELLKAMGITHILNTVPNCQALFKNTFTYHTVSSSPPDFEECFHFLDSVQQQQAKVLVYCMSGLSRSPAVVIAYIMKLRGWRLAESYKWVKDRRQLINLSTADAQRLQELELKQRGESSVPLGFGALDAAGAALTSMGQPSSSGAAASPFGDQGVFAGSTDASPSGRGAPSATEGVTFNFTGATTSSAPFVFGASPPAGAAAAPQANCEMEL